MAISLLRSKMKSLKYKIPFVILIAVIINLLLLYLFNRLVIFKEIAKRLSRFSGREVTAAELGRNQLILPVLVLEFVILIVMVLAISSIVYFMCVKPVSKLNDMVNSWKDNEIKYTSRQDEIGQLQNSFYNLSNRLKEEQKVQNRIIASISHDIKTPLTSVLGYSERLLKKELTKEKNQKYTQVIHQDARIIENIVGEFDEYLEDKMEVSLKKQEISVSFLIQMLEEEYYEELAQRNIDFFIDNTADEEIKVWIDLFKMRRVFANVIGNALKHNKKMEGLTIRIGISQSETKVFFDITNNGKSVKHEDLPYLFEPFYTTDNSRRLTGLGLSICKNIIESHNGTISAFNLEEGGFHIKIALLLEKN